MFASISADMKAIAIELYMNASVPGSVLLLGTLLRFGMVDV